MKELNKDNYKPQEEKIIKCIDCGKEFIITGNSKRARCNNCYKEYRKQQVKLAKEKWKEKQNN